MYKGLLVAVVLLMPGCRPASKHQEVMKPRYHHSWYRNHVHKKKIGIGRFRVRCFEKQGVKKVKMKS
jgi:hypothetical protein